MGAAAGASDVGDGKVKASHLMDEDWMAIDELCLG